MFSITWGRAINRRIIAILAILHCLAFIDRTMIGGIMPLIRNDIAMNDAQAGWIIGTAFALPYGATALALAAILRRRRVSAGWLIGGVVIWTAASIVASAARSVEALTLTRAALGIGQAMFVPVAIAFLFDVTSPDERPGALAAFTSGSTTGRSVALLAIGALLSLSALIAPGEIARWRWLFVVTALPNLVLLPLLVGLRPGSAAPENAGSTVAVEWRTLALFFAVAIMPVLLTQAIAGWLPTLMVRDRGLTPGSAATLLGALTLISAPAGQIAGGWLMGRYPRWHDRIPAIILTATAATLLPLATIAWAPGLIGTAAGVVGVNLMLGIAVFCGLFGVQWLIPTSARASVNGIYFALVTLVAFGAGPLMTGALAMASGGGATSLRRALLATGVIACGLCAIAVAAVQGRYRRRCGS